jgi:hypothetical protein
VRPEIVVIFGPFSDGASGMIEAEEQAFVEQFVTHSPVDGEDGPAPNRLVV